MARFNFLRPASVLDDSRGISVIETAFLLPILVMMLGGTMDVARAYSAKLSTQQAATRAMELASTKGVVSMNDTSVIKTDAATAAGVSENNVTVDAWLECSSVRQLDPNGSCLSTEETARYISVSISNSYTPIMSQLWGGSSSTVNFVGKANLRLQ